MFEISPVSENYSTLTLVMAGFLFASTVVLLVTPPKVKTVVGGSTTLFSLLTVFFIFLIASFGYATIPGHSKDEMRITALFFVAGCLFALGAVNMFVSMTWLFLDYGVSRAIVSCVRLLVHGVILVSAFNLIWVCALVVERLEENIEWHSDWTTALWAAPILLLPMLPIFFQRFRISDDVTDPRSMTVFRYLLLASLVFTLVSGIYFGVMGLLGFFYHPAWIKYFLMIGLAVLFYGAETTLPLGSLKLDISNILSEDKGESEIREHSPDG